MSAISEAFIRRADRARRQQGWTARQLAAKSGVPESTTAKILARPGELTLTNAVALASALSLSLDAATAPVSCATCLGIPPTGFSCQSCGAGAGEPS